MVRASQVGPWVTMVTMAAVALGGGCRQAQTRSGSPTPLPGPGSNPSAYEVPPPPSEVGIPPVPPSTAAIQGLEGNFGFTMPKLPGMEPLPPLEPTSNESDDEADEIQPAGSEEDDVAATSEPDVAVPLFSPLALPQKSRETPPVELDTSLFLIELFEEAAETPLAADAVPTTVNGLTIQPWNPDPNVLLREPQPWPADGITPSLVIAPGPILPKWSAEPLPTRAANSRPRRLMIENSDSDIRAIE